MTQEADALMKLDITESSALAEKAMGGAPGDVRRYMLHSAWLQIKADRGIPANAKPDLFRKMCATVEFEVVADGG